MAGESDVRWEGVVDVGSLLGDLVRSNPDSPLVRDFFVNLVEPLIDKIKNANVEGLKIDLRGLFGVDNELSKDVRKEYQKATKKLLQKVQTQIGKATEGIKLGDDFNLSSLIGATPQFKGATKKAYQATVEKFLNLVQTALPKKGLKLEKDITLGSLLGSTPQFALRAKFKYETIIWKVLNRIKEGLPKAFDIKKEFDIQDLLGGSKEFSRWTEHKYQGMVRKLLKKIGDLDISNLFKGDIDLASIIAPPRGGFVSSFEKVYNVVVSDFSEDALNKIRNVIGLAPKRIGEEGAISTKKKIQKGDVGPGMLGTLGLVLGGAGIAFLFSGLQDEGPLKGLKKFIGMRLVQFGHAMTGFLYKSVVAIFTKVKSFFSEAGKIGTEIGKVTPKALFEKAGSKISSLFSIENLLKRFVPESVYKFLFKEGGKETGKTLAKTATVGGAGKLMGKFLSKTLLKKIPFGLGAIFGLAFGISRFLSGDLVGGLLELASGIAAIAPGPGTAISIGIDALLAGRDIATGGSAEIGKKHPKIKNISNMIWNFLKTKSPIKGWILIGDAFKKFWSGQWVSGFKDLGQGLLDATIFGPIIDLFSMSTEEKGLGGTTGASKNWLSIFWKAITDSTAIKWLLNFTAGIEKMFTGDLVAGIQQTGIINLPGMQTLVNFLSQDISIPKLMETTLNTTNDFFASMATQMGDKIKDFLNNSAKWILDNVNPVGWMKGAWDKVNPFSGSRQPQVAKDRSQQTTTTAANLKDKVVVSVTPDNKSANLINTMTKVLANELVIQTKNLSIMTTGIQQLLGEFKKAGKDINKMASNDNQKGGGTQINQFGGGGQQPSPIANATIRDPAYEQRGKVWEKLRYA